MAKLKVIDKVIKDLIKKINDDSIDWASEKLQLISMIEDGGLIERKWPLKLIDDYCEDNNAAKILDYGCGSGILNLLLLLKGYNNVHGVDVIEKFDNSL